MLLATVQAVQAHWQQPHVCSFLPVQMLLAQLYIIIEYKTHTHIMHYTSHTPHMYHTLHTRRNIVAILGIGASNLSSLDAMRGSMFVVMESMSGGNLKLLVIRQMMSPKWVFVRLYALLNLDLIRVGWIIFHGGVFKLGILVLGYTYLGHRQMMSLKWLFFR